MDDRPSTESFDDVAHNRRDVGCSDISPGLVPAPGSEAAGAIAARAFEAPGFAVFAIAMTALALVGPGVLIADGLISTKMNGQLPQIVWGIVLAVIGLGVISLVSASGTTMNEKGLKRRRTLNGDWAIDYLAWDHIAGFVSDFDVGQSKTGHVWVVGTEGNAFRVQSDFHRESPKQAGEHAAYLNQHFGLVPSPDMAGVIRDHDEDYRYPTGAIRTISLLGFGFLSPFALLVGATATMRRWLWLVAEATFAGMVSGLVVWYSNNLRGSPVLHVAGPMVWFVGLWLGPTILTLGMARSNRRSSSQ